MRTRLGRGAVVAGLALGLLAGRATPTWAGQDICPEPNDAPENACAIGPNTSSGGYLDSPDDVDRDRISSGAGQSVQATLGTLPGSYTFRLEAEDGTVVADGNGSGTDDRALGANGLTGGT